jgi:hypothetical protein
MLALGLLPTGLTGPAFAPRGAARARRPIAGHRPEASILAMSRELATAAALRSTPEIALERVRPAYRAALSDAGASKRLTDCLVGGVFHFAHAAADPGGRPWWRRSPAWRPAPTPLGVQKRTPAFCS